MLSLAKAREPHFGSLGQSEMCNEEDNMPEPMPSILLVEDDEIDIEVIRRVFEKCRIANPLYVARNGVSALQMLRGEEAYDAVRRPCVILLDLNMPRMSGLEFLDHLRQDADLKDSVVFVLTTSNNDRDRMASYAKHVAGYLLKADADDGFSQFVRELRPVLRFLDN